MPLLLCLLIVAQAAAPTVSVFVTPATRDGFVDATPAILDSVRDVEKQIRGCRTLRLSPTAETAQVRLVIERRGPGRSAGTVAMPFGVFLPVDTTTIDATLKIGDFSHPFTCQSEGWTDCAKRLVRDVEAWVVANRAEIERRSKGEKS